MNFSSIDEAIEDIKNGKMIIIVDDEGRENEGDLVIPAEMATGENINFMITHAKGLLCAPIEKEIADKLGIYPMVEHNTDNHETAFTVSVDHIDTTTGISAYERACTIRNLAEENCKPDDFRRPGHVFPLIAKENGVFDRKGHTEGSIDLVKLAGFKGATAICEIIKDDGHMARRDYLMEFAQKFNLKIVTIEDLIEYRKKNECKMKKEVTANLPTKYGEFTVTAFKEQGKEECHLALVKGEINTDKPILVRVHSECLTGDSLGSKKCDCGEQYEAAMKMIEEEGNGVLLYMRQEGRGIGLLNKLKAYALQDKGMDTVDANLALGFEEDMRDYVGAAQILKMLGIDKVRLITNNPKKIEGLIENGIDVEERVPIEMKANKNDIFYLRTKKERMNHLLAAL